MPLREMNIKPSCLQELYALPSNMLRQVMEKFDYLAQDPFPDGDLKKKLKGWTDVYRLRVGEYRVFYTFGPDWIRLLGIRQRKDAYKSRDIRYETPGTVTSGMPAPDLDDDDADLFEGEGTPEWTPGEATAARSLPRPIDRDWLSRLNIPDEYHDALIACRTEDDLLAASVEPRYIERVIDNLFPRAGSDVIQQPDLLVFNTDFLTRAVEENLVTFLLRLDADQERLVDWALKGPALIKGGPGTGKSTIALYRVRSLLDHAEQAGQPLPKILFATYTPALTRSSEQLLTELLGERKRQVRVEVVDDLARRIVEAHEPIRAVAGRDDLEKRMEELLASRREALPEQVAKLRPGYLLDEIEWVIEGRNLKTIEEYLSADRRGRGVALNDSSRRAVWELTALLNESLHRAGLWTASRIRLRALELVQSGIYKERFDAVIIDEAQDLTPASLSLLVELAREARGVYLTADASQSIYFRGFSWQNVHERLRLRGKSLTLRVNYRSTREIAEAAGHFLETTGAGDLDSVTTLSSRRGPRPVLMGYGDDFEQWSLAADFIRQMSRAARISTAAAAVLVPSSSIGEQAEAALNALGLKAKFMRGSQLNLASDEVKVMTLQAAKGLEFPVLVVGGMHSKYFPRLPDGLDPEEREEELQTARRTFFVGITRAMRALLVLYARKHPSPFIAELNRELWDCK